MNNLTTSSTSLSSSVSGFIMPIAWGVIVLGLMVFIGGVTLLISSKKKPISSLRVIGIVGVIIGALLVVFSLIVMLAISNLATV